MTGTFELQAFPVGLLPIPGWERTFGVNDTGFSDLAFYIWVVTDGTTTGLIDLGLPADPRDAGSLSAACQGVDERSAFRQVHTLTEVLSEAGLEAKEIDFVALTQTITYHSGGLDAAALPRASVYLSRAGVTEMLVDPPGHPAVEFYFTESSWSSVRQLAIEGRLHLVDEPTQICAGVTFESTGGHHPGSAAVKIRTQEGITGLLETAFFQSNIETGVPIGIAEDAATCRKVMRRYLRECDQVIALHDPANAGLFPSRRGQQKAGR